MTEELPNWLEHYLQVPAWVVYKSVPDDRMLWVNQRIAEDMGKPREWFVGRSDSEIWTGGDEAKQGRRAVDEGRVIDVVGDGHDLRGTWRWLRARLTPVDRQHLLIVCQDITARIQLAGLRLVLGGDFAGTSQGDFSEGFARQLLEGASLQEICDAQSKKPTQVLAKLSRLVNGPRAPTDGIRVPPAIGPNAEVPPGVPEWIEYYWDLPVPAALLDYPDLGVLWVNRCVLERNEATQSEVIGLNGRAVWSDLGDWIATIDETMRQQRAIDSIQYGENLRGLQHWSAVRTTPLGADRVVLVSEDVTAEVQLQALRLLLGLNPASGAGPANISEAFARLLLDGASVENIAAALEMSREEVLGEAGLILDRAD